MVYSRYTICRLREEFITGARDKLHCALLRRHMRRATMRCQRERCRRRAITARDDAIDAYAFRRNMLAMLLYAYWPYTLPCATNILTLLAD